MLSVYSVAVSVAVCYFLVPSYISEISEKSNRGKISTFLIFIGCFGLIIPQCIGPYASVFCFNITLALISFLALVLFYQFAPESPYYLVTTNKLELASEILSKMRSQPEDQIKLELEDMKALAEIEAKDGKFVDLFKKKAYIIGLLIASFLAVGQKFSGINVIEYYTEEILLDAEIKSFYPELFSVTLLMSIGLTTLGSGFIIKRTGKKLLLLISSIGCTIGFALFGLYLYCKFYKITNVFTLSWFPVVTLHVYMFMHGIGLDVIPSTIPAELFPVRMKTYAVAVTTAINWTCSFLTIKFFEDMNKFWGDFGTFWFFASCCLSTFFFTLLFVPETNGKSFVEIVEELNE